MTVVMLSKFCSCLVWSRYEDLQMHTEIRGEHIMGIPTGPMSPVGIPWEWELWG